MAESEQKATSEPKRDTTKEKQPEVAPELGSGFESGGLDGAQIRRFLASPPTTPPGTILHLQRAIGNQSLLQLMGRTAPPSPRPLRPYAIQAKLMVGSAYDNYEQEADRVASQVMSLSNLAPSTVQRLTITPLIQRPVLRHPNVQRKHEDGFEAGDHFESRLSQTRGGGSPLPPDTRSFMEGRFGADFGQVRVHTGSEAVQLNREVNAQAFTHGSDIYFGAGKFNPHSDSGKHLLAHELTHTLQQGGGGLKTKRLIQRLTIQEQLYSQLAIPGSFGGMWSGVKGATLKVGKEALKEVAAEGVHRLCQEALELAATLLASGMAGDVVSFVKSNWRLITTATRIALGLYRLWKDIPPHFRILMAYVTGSILYGTTNFLHWREWGDVKGEGAISRYLITDKDSMKPLTQEEAAKTAAKLEELPKQLPDNRPERPKPLSKDQRDLMALQADKLQQAVQSVPKKSESPSPSQPSSSAPSSESASSGKPKAPEAPKSSLPSLKMPYFKLFLLDMQTRATKGDVKGGLFLKGGVEFNLFGYNFGQTGEELGAEVTLPWGWNQTPAIKLLASKLEHPGFKTDYFNVAGISVQDVKINNNGLEQGTFAINKLTIGNSVMVSGLKATWADEKLSFKGGTIKVDLFGFTTLATGFSLNLDKDGNFLEGGVDELNASTSIKIKNVKLTKEGLALKEATIILPKELKETPVVFSNILIDKTGISGSGRATVSKLNLIENKFFVNNAVFTGSISKEKGWSVGVAGAAKVSLDGSIGNLRSEGDFDITYVNEAGVGSFKGEGVKNGVLDFTLGGVVNFHADKISYALESNTLKVDTAALKLDLAKAQLGQDAGVLSTTAKGIVLGPNGFDFESIKFGYLDEGGQPKPVTLFKGITLANLGAEIKKKGEAYSVTGRTDLKVDMTSPAKVKGELKGASITMDGDGLSGGFTSFELNTAWFRLITTGGSFDKAGLSIASATLLRNSREEQENEARDTYGMPSGAIGSLKSAVEPMFQVTNLSITRAEGLQIKGEVKTGLKKVGINLFGVKGEVDFFEHKAGIGGELNFPPKTPVWPLRVGVSFPVWPGLDLSGYVEAGGGIKANLDVKGTVEDKQPLEQIEGKDAYKVTMGGEVGFNANLYGEAGVGIYAGSSVIFALGADLFLKVPLEFGVGGAIKGSFYYIPQATERKLRPGRDLTLSYDGKGALKAQVGVKLNAKFLYFFNKTLYTFKFKEWTLGSFQVKGAMSVNEQGNLVTNNLKEQMAEWQFLGHSNKPDAPTAEKELVELEGVEKLAAEAGMKIAKGEKQKAELLKTHQDTNEVDTQLKALLDEYAQKIVAQYSVAQSAARKEIQEIDEYVTAKEKKKSDYEKSDKKPTLKPSAKVKVRDEAATQVKLLEKLQALKAKEREDAEASKELEQLSTTSKSLPAFEYFTTIERYKLKIAQKQAAKESLKNQLGVEGEIGKFLSLEEPEQVKAAKARIEVARLKAVEELKAQEKNPSTWKDKLLSIKEFFKKIASIFEKKEKPVIPESEFVAEMRQEKASDLQQASAKEELSTAEKEAGKKLTDKAAAAAAKSKV